MLCGLAGSLLSAMPAVLIPKRHDLTSDQTETTPLTRKQFAESNRNIIPTMELSAIKAWCVGISQITSVEDEID
jgi:hypothetical protein